MPDHTTNQMVRSRQKKQQIYETSMRLFMENGYEKTTIRDICRACGITNSSFYNFFGDKLSILLHFYYQVLAKGDSFLAPTEDNLAHPYQTLCDYFVNTSILFDQISKELAELIFLNTHHMLADKYDSLPSTSTMHQITHFFEAAQKTGHIPENKNCREDAEYLLMGANGITFYWLTLSKNEKYFTVASRLMPKLFSTITDEPIVVRIV